MIDAGKIEIARQLIEGSNIKTFGDIFKYLPRTAVASQMGINYGRFLTLIRDPRRLRYSETYALAKILGVKPARLSEMIHYQIDDKSGRGK
jgi:hypothetical protein